MSQETRSAQRLRMKSKATPAQLWTAATTIDSLHMWLAAKVTGELQAGSALSLHQSNLHSRLEVTVEACQSQQHVTLNFKQPNSFAHRACLDFKEASATASAEEKSMLEVRLESTDNTSEGLIQRHQLSAWQTSLAALRYAAETTETWPPVAKRFGVYREGPAISRVRLRELFRTGAGLASWLSAGGVLGPAGSAFELILRDGERLCGRVLNDNLSSEVLLSCDNWQGLLELRARPMDQERVRYGLQGYTKNLDSPALEALQERLNQAIQRLIEQIHHAA
jgi:hypothetical protein